MTPREQMAFRAGVRAAIDMALVAAITIEVRDDAKDMRQRAAAAALQGFAEGAKAAFLEPQTATEQAEGGPV